MLEGHVSLFWRLVAGAAAGTLPASSRDSAETHTEGVVATVTVVTEHHLVLKHTRVKGHGATTSLVVTGKVNATCP